MQRHRRSIRKRVDEILSTALRKVVDHVARIIGQFDRPCSWPFLAGHPLYVSAIGTLLAAALLIMPLLAFRVEPQYGDPIVWSSLSAIGLSILAFLVLSKELDRRFGSLISFSLQNFALVAINILSVWLFVNYLDAEPRGDEMHVMNVFLFTICVYLILVRLFWWSYLERRRDKLLGQLVGVSLVDPPSSYRLTFWLFITAVLSPARRIHLIVVIVALIVLLFAPQPVSWWLISGSAALIWTIFALEPMSNRVRRAIRSTSFVLFGGIAPLLSLLVVIMAAAKIWRFSYLNDLFDEAGLILWYLSAGYLLAWYSNYWLSRFLVEAVLGVLGSSRAHPTYELTPTGGTRISVQAKAKDGRNRNSTEYFPHELLDRAMVSFRSRDRERRKVLSNLRVVCRAYWVATNVLLLALLFVPLGAAQIWAPKNPALQTTGQLAQIDLSLAELATSETSLCEGREGFRKIALSLSGGGTRAALFGVVVLDILVQNDLICDLFVVSGVSGGSAALAYFAANLDDLATTPGQRNAEAWDDFYDTMQHDYIFDAIGSLGEVRIAYGWPWWPFGNGEPWRQTRTGNLLAEAFEQKAGESTSATAATLFDVPKLGLIFNATAAGTSPDFDQLTDKRSAFADSAQGSFAGDCRGLSGFRSSDSTIFENVGGSSGELAGGRLVITNLASRHFPPLDYDVSPEDRLNFVVLNDLGIPLSRATSLSANFPPVFSNSAIDAFTLDALGRCREIRYWATDGGAFDNRGAISLLLALQAMTDDLSMTRSDTVRLPEVHVLIADASAIDSRLRQDRGISSAIGATRNLASALIQEKQRDLTGQGIDIQFHQLTMPRVFRENGIGTNWMLPDYVNLKRPKHFGLIEEPALRKVAADLEETDLEYIDLPTELLVTDVFKSMATPSELECNKTNAAAEIDKIELLKCWILLDGDRNFVSARQDFLKASTFPKK